MSDVPCRNIIDEDAATALAEVKQVAHANYCIDDDAFIDYALALAIANKFDASPLWGFLVGPPSSLKTVMLESLHKCSWTSHISTITPKTFISGWNDKRGKNGSLLYRLDKKVLVVKEFSSILQMRPDWRTSVFNDLREIYDGHLSKGYGTGDVVEWYGKMGLIAAVTPEIERHTAVNMDLGERFLYYRMSVADPRKIAAKARGNAMRAAGKKKQLSVAVLDFLSLFEDISDNPEIYVSDDVGLKLDALSVFCVKARTNVGRDRYDRSKIDVQPETEGVGRLSGQFSVLAQALAVVHGVADIDDVIYTIIKHVGRDLVPRRRMLILEFMFHNGMDYPSQFYSAEVVGLKLSIPTQTCRYDLDDLFMIGVLEKKLQDGGRAPIYHINSEMLCDALESEIFS
jgi:hypothetical protein